MIAMKQKWLHSNHFNSSRTAAVIAVTCKSTHSRVLLHLGRDGSSLEPKTAETGISKAAFHHCSTGFSSLWGETTGISYPPKLGCD